MRRFATLAAVVTVAAAGVAVAMTSAAGAAAACQVTYQNNGWTGGFTASIKVTAGDQAVNGWTLTWAYGGDQRITNAWNATVTQSGTAVTARNVAWNGNLAANGSTEFGVQGTWSSANPTPTSFALNGVACGDQGGTTTPPVTTPPVTTPPVTTPPVTTPPVTTPPVTTPPATTPPVTTPPVTTPPATGCGSAVLCDGFENQTGTAPSGAWSVTYPNCSGTGTASIDTAVSHSGGRSVRVNGGGGYCNHVFVRSSVDLAAVGNVWHGRFWVRHTTALPTSHTTFVAMRDAADGGKDLRIGGQNQALQWNRESDDATLPEQSPTGVSLSRPLPTNTWTCVEYRVDGAAGQLRTWIDGAEVAGLVVDGVPTRDIDSQWLNKANWRPSITDLRLGWESYGSDADTLWFDDVAVGANRIGC